MERGGIARAKQYALSDVDIREILGDVPIIPYPELAKYQSIDQLLDKQGRAILFFPNVSENIGHWCCIFQHPNGLMFWDPYGEAPDAQKEDLPEERQEALNIDRPDLTRLLKAAGRPVYYNSKDYQEDKSSVATCGRHCVVRLLYQPYSEDRYNSVIKMSGMSPDNFVVGLTYDRLHK
jgi:hypothetical protein